jgi:signal transduction histidine kinase
MPTAWNIPHVSPPWIGGLAAGATAVTLAVIGQVVDPYAVSVKLIALTAAIAVFFTAMAALVLAGVPGHPVGRLMAAAGLFACADVLAASWSHWLALSWLSRWLWWPPLGLIFLALLVFPDGRLPSRRWRPLAALIAAATVVATVGLAGAALDHPRTLFEVTGELLTPRAYTLRLVAKVAILIAGAGLLGVLWSLWRRWRRADGDTRQQLACLLPACVLLLITLVLETLDLTGAWMVAAVVVPVAMTVAVLRYHLYDLDQIINRTLVWLLMTLLVIVGFIALVTIIRDVLNLGEGHAELAATGLIAAAFEPLRRRVQRAVEHLLYGERDDPYEVIRRLGQLLGRTIDPNEVLPELTATITRSLRVPYVAVEIDGFAGPRVIAEHGRRTTAVENFDMLAHGKRIGRLIVATRGMGDHFMPRECRLIADVALQAAVAAEATQLTRDLMDSRERLVVAREEERLRLRRDLHDGVGPSLAGMSMQVRAARKLLGEPDRVGQILDDLTDDLRDCTAEMRQLVDQLRPPVLDNGLAAALRTEARRFRGPHLAVAVRLEDDLDGLPAAVEVAVYRIVAEALANVARHAGARTCRVTVRRDRDLTVTVVDDGVGITARRPGGFGLASIEERAAELGGDCVVTDAEPRGTEVRVRLPIPTTAGPPLPPRPDVPAE